MKCETAAWAYAGFRCSRSETSRLNDRACHGERTVDLRFLNGTTNMIASMLGQWRSARSLYCFLAMVTIATVGQDTSIWADWSCPIDPVPTVVVPEINVEVQTDPQGDVQIRRTDVGCVGPVNTISQNLPDIISTRIGIWMPNNPLTNPFNGTYLTSGDLFFRLDIEFAGLVNPPGPLGCCGDPTFAPFLYGPNPVLGYVEIDIDSDSNTGGELEVPEYHYLGNVGRFGGLPSQPWYQNRAAWDASAFDGNIQTPPFVDRSGEDFHIDLQSWNITSIDRSDQTDWIFGPGEVWWIKGRFFPRAHGYEAFSFACCEGNPGSYSPQVTIQFAHYTTTNRTVISLVYPLTNAGSAMLGFGGPGVEAPDGNVSNQTSIHEALEELVYSATEAGPEKRNDPNFQIIARWADKDPNMYLNPRTWRINLLMGTSYLSPVTGSPFVWTDIMPNVLTGDCDAGGTIDTLDLAQWDLFLEENDGKSNFDQDGCVNGKIQLFNFGYNFSLYDVNYNGIIDLQDRNKISNSIYSPFDFDHDGDVDLSDFGHLQHCLSDSSNPTINYECLDSDLDKNGFIDQNDMWRLRLCLSGAGASVDPMCGH